MSFADRAEAGRKLAAALRTYRADHPVVLALPRGGVPVAVEVAQALDAPLDLVLVKKIGVPGNPELAAGAVVEGQEPVVVRNEDVISWERITNAQFDSAKAEVIAELSRRRKAYLGERPTLDIAGRTVILVDDGVATGSSMRAALAGLRSRRPRRLVVAVPVGPTDTISQLEREADDVICLETHDVFGGVGRFYRDFRQLDDTEVTSLLAQAGAGAPPNARAV